MCKCRNITPQTAKCYAQQVELDIPPHMQAYWEATVRDGRKPTICIDPCIVEEIQDLWYLGITTYGSCCGHNKFEPMVNVDEKDIPYMLKMGYEINQPDKSRQDTFRLTSVPFRQSHLEQKIKHTWLNFWSFLSK